jgi:hypothetical protein
MAFNSKKAPAKGNNTNNANQVQKKFKNIIKLTSYDSACQLGSAIDQYGGYSLNVKVADRLENATETHVYDYDNNTFIFVAPKKAITMLEAIDMVLNQGYDHTEMEMGIWSIQFTAGEANDPKVDGIVAQFINTDTDEAHTFLFDAKEDNIQGWKHGEDKPEDHHVQPSLKLFIKWLEENVKQAVLPHDGFMVSNDTRQSAVGKGNGGASFRKNGPTNTARRNQNAEENNYQPNDDVGDTTAPF